MDQVGESWLYAVSTVNALLTFKGVNIDPDSVLDLLSCASFHGVDELVDACEDYLIRQGDMSKDTIKELLKISNIFNLQKLATVCTSQPEMIHRSNCAK